MSDQLAPEQVRQLRESEERYRSVAEDAPVLICRILPGGKIIYVNEAYCHYFNKTSDELVGQTIFSLIPEQDRETVRTNIAALSVDSPTMSHEHLVIAPDGELRRHRWTNRALFDAGGSVFAYQAIGEDITERKRAEEESNKATRMLNDVLDTIPVRVFWKDLKGVFLGCNQLFARDTGKNHPNDVIGQDDYSMGWAEQAEMYRADDRHVIENGQPKINYEEPQTTPEGKRIWLRTSKIPLRNSRGNVYGILGTYEDITHQKWAESLRNGQQHILELISTGKGSLASIFGAIIHFTENAFSDVRASILHVDHGKLRRGTAPSMPAAYNELLDGLEIGPNVGSCGTAAYRKERVIVADVTSDPLWASYCHLGTEYGFSACWSEPIFASGGEVVATFALYRERPGVPDPNEIQLIETMARLVSIAIERERAEGKRRELEIQLRHSQKMEALGHLAGGVAHDFNNLLTVVLGNSEMLLSATNQKTGTNFKDRLRRGLGQIQSAGEQAAILTRRLLTFSRRDIPKAEVLVVNSVVDGMEEMLRRIIGEHIQLDFKLNNERYVITADAGQIEQLILNLVVNARDAMPNGGLVEVRVKDAVLDEKYVANRADATLGRHVLLSVTDSGVGMTPDTIEHMFEPFFTTKPPGKGTGLGLATVYGIVQQLGGHIRVDSKPDAGSTFTVYIPISDKTKVEEKLNGEVATRCATETILVCEDDAMVRSLMCQTLRSVGYTVIEASSGKQALAEAAAYVGTIDMLVSDVVMPGMNGKALADSLMKRDAAMCVLFVSGFSENHLDAGGVWHGTLELLQKPFGPRILLRRVREVLDAKGTN